MLPEHQKQLANAVRSHQAGRIDIAQEAYLLLRTLYPRNFDVVHLLGLTFLQTRQFARSLETLKEAITLNPKSAMAHSNLGNAYKASGDIELALKCYDMALSLKPNFPEARYNRGNARQALNDPAGALRDYDDVVREQPHHYLALVAKSNALSQLGHTALALQAIDAAIAINPRFAEALSNRGAILVELGRYDEAAESLNRAIKLKPTYADAYYSIGNLETRLTNFVKALASYDKAISLNPDYAEAYSSRGNTLIKLGRVDEAHASYDKAISLKPGYAPAWLGLARIDSETGRFAEAEVKYRKARSLDSKLVEPLCGIAEVKSFDSSDPLIPEIQELLSSASLSDDDRAQLHHAYAKICNDLGRYDEAVENFSLGKSLMKSKFSIERHSDGYAALRRLFKPEFFAERDGFGLPDERPVFVVGMPRSGTTLAEQILASHHLVDGLGELPDMPGIVKEWCGGLSSPEQFALSVANLTQADVKTMAERYLEAYGRARKTAIRIVDKRPHNYEWLGVIALMFPKAHIVHCQRNPLDTCVSIYMQTFTESHGYNQDLSVLGRYFQDYTQLMDHWATALPLPVHKLVYEDIVSDLEASSRSLVSFLGLEWDPNCLRYHQQERQVSTPSRWQVRQPLYDKSVGRWRRYERHLGPLRDSLGVLARP